MPKQLWVEKWRPSTLDGYIFQNKAHEDQINKWITEQSIPNLLLSGHRGTGKTTLAHILKNQLNVADGDFKVLNASDENSVDTIRTKIKSFAQTMPIGDFKIVFLDEADYLSINAQAALRGMIEEFSDTVRFILTCNHPNKIIPELKSRCHELKFREFDKKEMLKAVVKILKAEGVRLKDSNVQILKDYADDAFPDMRKLLMTLQANVIDGILNEPFEVSDKISVLVDLTEELSKGNWLKARESIVQNIGDSDWEDIYKFMYNHLHEIEGFDNQDNWSKGILIIADALYKHSLVADPEINFSAFMIRMLGVIQNG